MSAPFATKLCLCGVSSRAGMLCDKFGLLCSGSRSQWGFKSSENIIIVRLDNIIFWSTCPFLMKLGMTTYHRDLERRAKSLSSYTLKVKVKVTVQAQILHISWTSEPFASKLGTVVHHQRQDCFVSGCDCCPHGQGHGEGWYLQRTQSQWGTADWN